MASWSGAAWRTRSSASGYAGSWKARHPCHGSLRRDSVTKKAGRGENWTPREFRHSFVSIMSDTIEEIADLVGHRTTVTTQKVYRHQLRPVISTGATAMNTIFNRVNKKEAKSA
jgi:integrase